MLKNIREQGKPERLLMEKGFAFRDFSGDSVDRLLWARIRSTKSPEAALRLSNLMGTKPAYLRGNIPQTLQTRVEILL